MLERIKGRWRRFLESLPGAKERGEMDYWLKKKAEEGTLRNDHYQPLYTDHFGLDPSFYAGKSILDIGCGPRGSLEWATMAARRVGLDTLADRYRKLGTDAHAMEYIAVGMEDAPFPDHSFDVVCSVNSLDHVADVDKTIAQAKRVVKPGGLFLLLVEVNHAPTVCEPITLGWDIVKQFEPEFHLTNVRHFETAPTMAEALAGPEYDHSDPTPRTGMLSAMMTRADLGELSKVNAAQHGQWFKPDPFKQSKN